MELAHLPQELLANIVSHLRSFEVERLSRSFNRAIYAACSQRVQARVTARNIRTDMLQRFPNHKMVGYDGVTEYTYDKLGWDEMFGPHEPQRLSSLEYIELSGDLSWLQPRDHHCRCDPSPHIRMAEFEQSLRDQARRLSVIIPESYFILMRNPKLQCKVAHDMRYAFEMGLDPQLRKCPSYIDDGAGGYVIPLAHDWYANWTRSLYLDPGPNKAHCVLWTAADPHNSDDDTVGIMLQAGTATDVDVAKASAEGVELAFFHGDVFQEDTLFERWLLRTCFEEALERFANTRNTYQEEEMKTLDGAQREYIRIMYTKEGRGIGIGK